MNFKDNLCKQCKECIELLYDETNRLGTNIRFKYCKRNEDIIKKYRYGYVQ